jgi:hypothetical protein
MVPLAWGGFISGVNLEALKVVRRCSTTGIIWLGAGLGLTYFLSARAQVLYHKTINIRSSTLTIHMDISYRYRGGHTPMLIQPKPITLLKQSHNAKMSVHCITMQELYQKL